MISENFHRDAALTWHDQGFCVIPVRSDGSKRPSFDWKAFMAQRATRSLTAKWYEQDPTRGVGLICGNISGGLEMTELEGDFTSSEALDKLKAECDVRDITWLWDLLTLDGYAEWTANGGIHTVYRISDHDVPGNTKLAMDVTGKITYAETRGEGGFVVVAPTFIQACRHTPTHEEGDSWVVAAGEIGKVPVITWADRNLLHEAIKAAFDERVERVYEAPAPRPIRERAPGEVSVVEDFNARGDWTQILTERGWSYAGKQNGQDTWTRPGKDPRDGHSAALGHMGSPNLYVWSGMDEERHYTKYQFVGFSDFNADWAATTRHLASQGYGTPLEPRPSKPARADYDYSDLLPEKVTVSNETSENEAVQESEAAPRPKIREFDDLGVCRFLAKRDPWKIRFVDQEKQWRAYADGHWSLDVRGYVADYVHKASDEVKAQAYARLSAAKEAFAEQGTDEMKDRLKTIQSEASYAKTTASNRGANALTEMLSKTWGIRTSRDDFNADRRLLAMRNGTLSLDTFELGAHDPSHMLTKAIPAAFDPEAKAPQWEKALEAWLPDPEQRKYVQRLAGYTLTADMTQAVVPILHGKGGSGKSQFLEVLEGVFGDYTVVAEANTFLEKKGEATNSVHDLRDARFVSISEVPDGALLNEELVKRFSGGDQVRTRALYENNQQWKPTAVIWMAANDLPRFRADDTGMARRIKPVHFAGTFEGSDDRVYGLAARILQSEMAGVFNWLLEGVRMYREHGLAEPEIITEAFADYQAELDPVRQFLDLGPEAGRIVIGKEARIKTSELYNAFRSWCVDNNVRPYGQDRFSKRLKALGYESVKSNNVRSWIGIGLDVSGGIHAAQQPRFQGRQF